jgi:hypothetical protein
LPVSESYRSGCGPAFLLFDESRSSTPCACVLGICISYLRVLLYPLDDMFYLRDLTWCRSPYSVYHNLAQGHRDSDGYWTLRSPCTLNHEIYLFLARVGHSVDHRSPYFVPSLQTPLTPTIPKIVGFFVEPSCASVPRWLFYPRQSLFRAPVS